MTLYLTKSSKISTQELDQYFITEPKLIELHKKIAPLAFYYSQPQTLDMFNMNALKERKKMHSIFELEIQRAFDTENIKRKKVNLSTVYLDDSKNEQQINTLIALLSLFGLEMNVSWVALPHFYQYTLQPTILSENNPQNHIELTLDKPHLHILWTKSKNARRSKVLEKFLFDHKDFVHREHTDLIKLKFK